MILAGGKSPAGGTVVPPKIDLKAERRLGCPASFRKGRSKGQDCRGSWAGVFLCSGRDTEVQGSPDGVCVWGGCNSVRELQK